MGPCHEIHYQAYKVQEIMGNCLSSKSAEAPPHPKVETLPTSTPATPVTAKVAVTPCLQVYFKIGLLCQINSMFEWLLLRFWVLAGLAIQPC
jgi:hypothetical protein